MKSILLFFSVLLDGLARFCRDICRFLGAPLFEPVFEVVGEIDAQVDKVASIFAKRPCSATGGTA
jgi:hypothetical protein